MKRHLVSLIVLLIVITLWVNFFEVNIPVKETSGQVDQQQTETPIGGESEHTLQQAKEWAKSRGATDDFISVADIYWHIGEQMKIRPDVMYAQSAKETAFGKYTGNVTKEMNNFAGIKKAGAVGDQREAHETFKTSEEGIRAHYNHMAAYVGIKPTTETHERYDSIMSTPWAGTIKYVEELGTKWAPSADYGNSIVRDYLDTI